MQDDIAQHWVIGWLSTPSLPVELWPPPSARNLRASFSTMQIVALRQAGVVHVELDELLKKAVCVVMAYSRKTPRVAAVTAPLKKLIQSADLTRRALDALMTAPEYEAARVEARQRLVQASWRTVDDPLAHSPLLDITGALERLLASARGAIEGIPVTQTHESASTYPIRYIDDALWFGYQQAHGAQQPKQRLMYRFRPSDANDSSFRMIVNVCYEAAGVPVGRVGPLRAIRTYIAQRYPSRPRKPMKKRQRRK